jgi:hypothetical protein
MSTKKGDVARKRYFKAKKSKKTTKIRFIIKLKSARWEKCLFSRLIYAAMKKVLCFPNAIKFCKKYSAFMG